MKSILIALLVLLIAANASAQILGDTNVFTFDGWSTTAYDANCFRLYDNSMVTMGLYLLAPVNFDFGDGVERDVTNVGGIECKLTGTEGVNILGWSFPVPHVNVGRPGEMVVGYGVPIPVTGYATLLANVEVFIGNVTTFTLLPEPLNRCVNEYNAMLNITPTYNQSLVGTVSFIDADDPTDPLVAGRARSLMISLYVEQPVSTDRHTWGTVKALFR